MPHLYCSISEELLFQYVLNLIFNNHSSSLIIILRFWWILQNKSFRSGYKRASQIKGIHIFNTRLWFIKVLGRYLITISKFSEICAGTVETRFDEIHQIAIYYWLSIFSITLNLLSGCLTLVFGCSLHFPLLLMELRN